MVDPTGPFTFAADSETQDVMPYVMPAVNEPAPGILGPDDILPCDVRLPPATTIRKGCAVKTLLFAIGQRIGREDTTFPHLTAPTEGEETTEEERERAAHYHQAAQFERNLLERLLRDHAREKAARLAAEERAERFDRDYPSGLSTTGINIRGDRKSIDNVSDALHKAAQIEEWREAFDNRLAAKQAEIAHLRAAIERAALSQEPT
jgi:hypothetical protein